VARSWASRAASNWRGIAKGDVIRTTHACLDAITLFARRDRPDAPASFDAEKPARRPGIRRAGERAQVTAAAGGTVSTVVFACVALPMLRKAADTKDLASDSLGNIVMANVGNLVHLTGGVRRVSFSFSRHPAMSLLALAVCNVQGCRLRVRGWRSARAGQGRRTSAVRGFIPVQN
jgi:hypothetical protein